MFKVSILSKGYIGLCTGVGFAEKGYEVTASTFDKEKASLINQGVSPFFEPKLGETLPKVVESGRLKVVYEREEAVLNSDLPFPKNRLAYKHSLSN